MQVTLWIRKKQTKLDTLACYEVPKFTYWRNLLLFGEFYLVLYFVICKINTPDFIMSKLESQNREICFFWISTLWEIIMMQLII